MSMGNESFNDDRVVVLTQKQQKQLVIDKLRWHLTRKPDLTPMDVMALLKTSHHTAQRYLKAAKEAQS